MHKNLFVNTDMGVMPINIFLIRLTSYLMEFNIEVNVNKNIVS